MPTAFEFELESKSSSESDWKSESESKSETEDEDQSVPRWWVQVYWRGACANGLSLMHGQAKATGKQPMARFGSLLLQKCGRVTLELLSPAHLSA